MISITVSNATLILGAHAIFRDLNWEIQHDQKIGLIGPNGAGKSSLFKLIIGEHSPEKGGAVIRARGVTVGYLSQHPEFEPEKTALTLALEGNPRLAEIEADLRRVLHAHRRIGAGHLRCVRQDRGFFAGRLQHRHCR